MKRKRIANAIIFSIILGAIDTTVAYEWSLMGCKVSSLVLALVMYTVGVAGFWFIIDQAIKERR